MMGSVTSLASLARKTFCLIMTRLQTVEAQFFAPCDGRSPFKGQGFKLSSHIQRVFDRSTHRTGFINTCEIGGSGLHVIFVRLCLGLALWYISAQ